MGWQLSVLAVERLGTGGSMEVEGAEPSHDTAWLDRAWLEELLNALRSLVSGGRHPSRRVGPLVTAG